MSFPTVPPRVRVSCRLASRVTVVASWYSLDTRCFGPLKINSILIILVIALLNGSNLRLGKKEIVNRRALTKNGIRLCGAVNRRIRKLYSDTEKSFAHLPVGD